METRNYYFTLEKNDHYKRMILAKDNMVLNYYILKSEIVLEDKTFTTYGVCVEKRLDEDGISCVETKSIENIFCSEKEAIIFLDMLIKNTVTPISLFDIVNDCIE